MVTNTKWSLCESNAPDFLLARQVTTPCSPRPHIYVNKYSLRDSNPQNLDFESSMYAIPSKELVDTNYFTVLSSKLLIKSDIQYYTSFRI